MKPNDCIFFQIAKTHQAAMRFLSERMAPYRLTVVQSMVLAFLCDADGITSTELGTRTQLDSATLTGIIDRLEAAGYVRREKHPSDRRAVMILLTDEGTGTAKKVRADVMGRSFTFLPARTGLPLHSCSGTQRAQGGSAG